MLSFGLFVFPLMSKAEWGGILSADDLVRIFVLISNLSEINIAAAAAAAKSLQLCLTLCDPIDSSPPGSPVPGILQARTLEWVAISFSNALGSIK